MTGWAAAQAGPGGGFVGQGELSRQTLEEPVLQPGHKTQTRSGLKVCLSLVTFLGPLGRIWKD